MRRIALALFLLAISPLPAGAANVAIRSLPGRAHRLTTNQPAGGFSVDLPVVGRVRGVSATFHTALDVTNNSASPTDVEFYYTPADGSSARNGILATLSGFDNLHVDDFIQSLADAGVITPAQADDNFGTLLLTFTNPSFLGTEATATARIYNAGFGGTFGLAYRARSLTTNGAHALAALLQAGEGENVNVGLENLGIDDAGGLTTESATVTLSFIDPQTGEAAGTPFEVTLTSGQLVQINDILHRPEVPPGVDTLLLFVDEKSGTAQIRGYAVTKDNATSDGSFVFMEESAKEF